MKGQRMAYLMLFSCVTLLVAAHAVDDGGGPVVHTTAGRVRGFRQQLNGKVVNSFTGIRYGKAPVGALRFRKPQPAESWTGIADATQPAPACNQVNFDPWSIAQDSRAHTEDCLFLNVWSPARNKNTSDLAVMVWIHGGAFQFGSSSLSIYDGAFLAAYGDVVIVSMNYRLGALGFLNGGTQNVPGNQGHLDQSLALHWVRDNIGAFGGDRGSVTLFGESAGSVSVEFHLLSPDSKALFQRAIMQSGALCSHTQRANDPRLLMKLHRFAVHLNCTNSPEPDFPLQMNVIECLRRSDPEHLQVAERSICPSEVCFRTVFGVPSLQSEPCTTEYQGNKDILIGHVVNEGGMLVYGSFPAVFQAGSPQNLTKTETVFLLAPLLSPPSPELLDELHNLYTRDIEDTDFEKLRRAIQDAWGDRIITCPSKETSVRLSSNSDNSVFYYILNHTSSSSSQKPWNGMSHLDDVLYVFGRPVVQKASSDDQNYSKKLMGLWTSFAKYGKQHLVEAYQWPQLLPGNLAALKITNRPPEQTTLNLGDRCRFWSRVYLLQNQYDHS
ncbi:acetylcholinesterase-like [Ixodes scapularis]|uniref:acetylcholinesterase-like n=1 Tax=Ixodes scapularis TaxID=6945 RepID=UPI001A9D33B5|nr:acetylcholinesterase-like [Ixodes scapularis]